MMGLVKKLFFCLIILSTINIAFATQYPQVIHMQFYNSSGDLLNGTTHDIDVFLYNSTDDLIYSVHFPNITLDSNGRTFQYLNVSYDMHDEVYAQVNISNQGITNKSLVGYVPLAVNAKYLDGKNVSYFQDQLDQKYNSSGGTINGNVIIAGDLTVIGTRTELNVTTVNVNGSFYPSLTETFDLGTSANRWKNFYVKNIYSDNMYNSSQIDSFLASLGNWTNDKPNYVTISMFDNGTIIRVDNVSWINQSGLIKDWGSITISLLDNGSIIRSSNTSWINQSGLILNWSTIIVPLTLSQIATNIGNWSADKSGLNNYSLSQISSNIGNWTNDKSNYALLNGSNQPFTGNLNISKSNPKIQLTDTGDWEYATWTRTTTNNLVSHKARVAGPGATALQSGSKSYTGTAANPSYPDTNNAELTNGYVETSPSYWYSDYSGYYSDNWHRIDLGTPYILSSVRFNYMVDNSNGIYAPTALTILGSNDDATYDTLATYSQSGNWQSTTGYVYWSNNLTVTGTYRYVKFSFSRGVGSSNFLDELQVYGALATSITDVTYLSIQNGQVAGESSKITLGASDSQTVIDGLSTRFNVAGVEKGAANSSGMYWTGLNVTAPFYFGNGSFLTGLDRYNDSVAITTNLLNYALLNSSNQPFRGNVSIANTTPRYTLNDTSSNISYWQREATFNRMTIGNNVLKPALSISGGTESTIVVSGSTYKVHVCTSNCTLTVTGSGNVEYLIVAGGGGGAYGGGGGGGGGVLNGTTAVTTGTYNVIIGAGGSPQAKGFNSSFNGLSANGGGAGNSWNGYGELNGAGGSGGGGARAISAGVATPSGQGYNGGSGDGGSYWGNGGGGWGEVGGTDGQRAGGDGLLNNITGTNTYYAGGGAGASISGGDVAGGDGGGGKGTVGVNSPPYTQNNAGAGTNGLGGGGGSSAYNQPAAGGSGVVIIRYVTGAGTYTNATALTSQDGINAGEGSVITLGNAEGRDVLDGLSIRFNVAGVEKGAVNSSGVFWTGLNETAPYFFGNASFMSGITTFNQALNTTSNVTFNNLSATGNISAQYIFGNGSFLNSINPFNQILNTTSNVNFNSVNTSSLNVSNNINIGGTANITGNVVILGNLSVKRPYWSGYDNSTQNFLDVNSVQVVNISNNNDIDSYQITVVGNQNITFSQTGDYQITFMPEFYQGGGSNKIINFWIQKNGVDVPWSNTRYAVANGDYIAPAITYQVDINNPATDNIRIMWWSDSTLSQIISIIPAGGTPSRPSIPGVLVNVQKVSEITP